MFNIEANLANGAIQSLFPHAKKLQKQTQKYKPQFNGWETANDMPYYKHSPNHLKHLETKGVIDIHFYKGGQNQSPKKRGDTQQKKNQINIKNKLVIVNDLKNPEKQSPSRFDRAKSIQKLNDNYKLYNIPIPASSNLPPRHRVIRDTSKKQNPISPRAQHKHKFQNGYKDQYNKKLTASEMDILLS